MTEEDTRPFTRLVGAIVQQAVKDAQKGDIGAQSFLQATVGSVDVKSIDRRLLRRGDRKRCHIN